MVSQKLDDILAFLVMRNFASECTLAVGITFSSERCKLWIFVFWSHDLPNMVMSNESEGNLHRTNMAKN